MLKTDSTITVQLIVPKLSPGSFLYDRLLALQSSAPPDIKFIVDDAKSESAKVKHYFKLPPSDKIDPQSVFSLTTLLSHEDGFMSLSDKWKRLKAVGAMICASDGQRQMVLRRSLCERAFVVRPGLSSASLHADNTHHPHLIVLGASGELPYHDARGFSYITSVAKHLNPARFKFVALGHYWTCLVERLRHYGFEVNFSGSVPWRVESSCYRQAGFVVLPLAAQDLYQYERAIGSGATVLSFADVHKELSHPQDDWVCWSGRADRDAHVLDAMLTTPKDQTIHRRNPSFEDENKILYRVYRELFGGI